MLDFGVFQSIIQITFAKKAEGGDSIDFHLNILFFLLLLNGVLLTSEINRLYKSTCIDMNQLFKSLSHPLACNL